jgi:DNA polymerase-3 subunit gamma/tau
MVDHLAMVAGKEGITAEPQALGVIARYADGAMRDALSIFDQVAASSRGNITYASTIENLNLLDNSYFERLTDAFKAVDIPGALNIYREVRDKGFDSLFFINGVARYIRDLMVARDPNTIGLLEATEDVRQAMAQRAAQFAPDFFYRAMSLLNDADLNYRVSSNKQFLVELTLIKLCQLLCPSTPAMTPRGN